MSGYDDLPPTVGGAITSTGNPRVKGLVELRRRKARDLDGVTLIDGYDELALALDAGVTVRTLYYCPELVTDASRLSLAETLAALGSSVVRLGRAAFAKASYRESPDGWLAVVPSPQRPLAALMLPDLPLVLVAESVEKPGNLGAMLRTAEAAGVDAVVAASPVTDWGNPNVVRASKGTVFAVPIASATTSEAIAWLRDRGLSIVVATPETDVLVTDVDLTGGTAVVVGAEHAGVSDAWRRAADHSARIPMAGRVNSLNVATSAAVVLFEAVRQRSAARA
ncbi:MAG: RNA methyltransferase [Actinomycetota bacterium]|nr:RNA methyltransferase [Actinomycetota bacterium]